MGAIVIDLDRLQAAGIDFGAADLAIEALLTCQEAIGPEGATFETICRMTECGALTINQTHAQGEQHNG